MAANAGECGTSGVQSERPALPDVKIDHGLHGICAISTKSQEGLPAHIHGDVSCFDAQVGEKALTLRFACNVARISRSVCPGLSEIRCSRV